MPDLTDLLRNAEGPVRLKARWVLPISGPLFENGEVAFENGILTYVGRARPDAGALDLGLAAILPGLVNVHAHLEYTVLRGLLEDMPFFPWIRGLTGLKAFLTLDDWVTSATLGAAELAAAGITTVGDACDAGATINALVSSGLRGTVFREVFGIESQPPVSQTLDVLRRQLAQMGSTLSRSNAESRVHLGVSPHAPYTVRAELFQALADFSDQNGYLQTIHLAESPAEEALFQIGGGPFKEMFDRRGIAWPTKDISPIAYAKQAGALDARTLAVHCVHASDDDITLLANAGASVAHCPRSNGKLGAGLAPLRALKERGLDIGLGTDSMVSGNSADFFEEMRAAVYGARAREQDTRALTAKEALFMATLGGARALHREREVGSLELGKQADLCVVRLDGVHHAPVGDDNPEAALVYSARASDVCLTLVAGQAVYDHGRYPTVDVARLRQSVLTARRKVRSEGEKILGEAKQQRY
ncbi:amidohydrolase family protein [Armatimonas rosea]|uniref:5-methylthioadenosine/S-adenosylhomocysteine deaminase n=1 Tax=Armatimonas rosea TaxID=685828 RepID=A0A7W9SUK9_ARMRO|nr:amidohydrolase family protein [Armatimonas rosea]MBB6052660.1 5-methylthioadenosine/S-adenosylhomocysteine deaminase [Armatimonas rosea]